MRLIWSKDRHVMGIFSYFSRAPFINCRRAVCGRRELASQPQHRSLVGSGLRWLHIKHRPASICLVEIREAGPCRGGVHRLHGCVRRSPIRRIWAWRAWRLPGRWPDAGLSEGYAHDGPGVCLGDGQTEDEGVPSQGGRGDALLRRMPPYLTWPGVCLYTKGFISSYSHLFDILNSLSPG